MARLNAPWTEEQVKAIRAYQARNDVHPFTCAEHSDVALRVCPPGLFCPVAGCDYTQHWVHDWMARGDKAARGEDYTVIFSPEAEAQMAADPKAADAVREVIARMRQALDGVADEDVDDALRSVGFQKIELEDD